MPQGIFDYKNKLPPPPGKINCELTISYRLPQMRPVIYTDEWTIRD
jgi:hypothetical protein